MNLLFVLAFFVAIFEISSAVSRQSRAQKPSKFVQKVNPFTLTGSALVDYINKNTNWKVTVIIQV